MKPRTGGKGSPVDPPSDEDLLRSGAEDPQAFTILFDRYGGRLLGFFARRTLDAEAAADLTSETFAQAFVSRSRFRDRGAGVAGWLYTIAHHQLGRYLRRRRIEDRARRRLGIPPIELADDDIGRIEALIDFEAVGRAVASAFAELTPDQRQALTLRVIEGRPYAEAARLIGCSEEVVRARVSRGLRRLAARLDFVTE